MPKEVEDRLKAAAAKKGYTGSRADHFVYGTLANMKKRKKGKGEMQREAIGGKP